MAFQFGSAAGAAPAANPFGAAAAPAANPFGAPAAPAAANPFGASDMSHLEDASFQGRKEAICWQL
jgi:hypothetical protein